MTVADQEIGNNITCSALLSSRIHFHDQQVRVFFPPLDRKKRTSEQRRQAFYASQKSFAERLCWLLFRYYAAVWTIRAFSPTAPSL